MLKELLKKDYVILDGGMGTNLFSKGLTSGECPELWNIENPKKITHTRKKIARILTNVKLKSKENTNKK